MGPGDPGPLPALYCNACMNCMYELQAAILDDRKSLSITFLANSNQYATLIFFLNHKMAAGGHFG